MSSLKEGMALEVKEKKPFRSDETNGILRFESPVENEESWDEDSCPAQTRVTMNRNLTQGAKQVVIQLRV